MDFDLKTRHANSKEAIIVELDITCDGVDFKESEVMSVDELKTLKVQLEDSTHWLEEHIKYMEEK